MLRSRIITGLVLALTALISIYLLPLPTFAVFFWLVGLIAAYEYAGLAGVGQRWLRWAYAGLYSVLVLLTYLEPALPPDLHYPFFSHPLCSRAGGLRRRRETGNSRWERGEQGAHDHRNRRKGKGPS